MIRLTCYHGWGFEPEFWNPLRDEFKQRRANVELVSAGSGYRQPSSTGDDSCDQNFDAQSNSHSKWIAVGHSLGFARLLSQWPLANPPLGLISINGFTRFCKSGSQSIGTDPRIIRRMNRALQIDANSVLQQFHLRCGISPEDSSKEPTSLNRELNLHRLSSDLSLLETINQSNRLAETKIPWLALAGRMDKVVPPELTADCFAASQIVWHESAEHLIPINHTEWCADKILEFAQETVC